MTIKLQDFYSTTITEEGGILGSGDIDFTVSSPPLNTKGFIVISANNQNLRDVMFYHNVIGNRIYVRKDNRLSGIKFHTAGEPVQINDTAQIFNYFSDLISSAFFIEKTGGLNILVEGGYVNYNGNQQLITSTALVLANNTTNYLKYDYPSNTLSVDTINSGNIKAVIVTASGVVTSILYRTSKESFIDFTVSLTGALPSQTGNAGEALMTDGSNVSWGKPDYSGVYSPVSHNHSGVYSPIGHDHSGVYSPVSHTHTGYDIVKNGTQASKSISGGPVGVDQYTSSTGIITKATIAQVSLSGFNGNSYLESSPNGSTWSTVYGGFNPSYSSIFVLQEGLEYRIHTLITTGGGSASGSLTYTV